jgi:type IV secretory pathway protease TraF
MLGDNRDNSADSRFIGAVHEKYILGQANKIVLSTQRTDRFFHDLL